MTQIALIVVLYVAGLAFAIWSARWLSSCDTGGAEPRRMALAVRRATQAFMLSEYRSVAAAAAAGAVLVYFGYASLAPEPAAFGRYEAALWAALLLAGGAATVCALTGLVARLSVAASARALAATRVSIDHSLRVAVRSAISVGLVTDALSALALGAVFALLYSMKGGFALGQQGAGLLQQTAELLPCYVLGGALAALVLQRGGAAFRSASEAGSCLAVEREAGLERSDARNPTLVAQLVGEHAGSAASAAADAFVCTSAAGALVALVGTTLFASHDGSEAIFSLTVLPFLVRAFGTLGTVFGALVVRAEPDGNIGKALVRGYATSLTVTLGGLFGACLWLSPPGFWVAAVVAGSTGLAAVSTAAFLRRASFERRSPGQRELGEWLRLGDAPTIAAGLADGLRSAALPASLLGAAVCVAWGAGKLTGIAHGGLFATLVALMTMLAPTANVLAARLLSAVTASVRSGSQAPDQEEGSFALRARRLETTSLLAGAMARVYLAEIGCATAWFSVAVAMVRERTAPAPPAWLDGPMGLFAGALGACLVLWYVGSGLKVGLRGTRAVVLEVQRQLRGYGRERGVVVLPEDFTPSYKNCLDESAGAVRRGLPWLPALAILSPAALGIALGLLYRKTQPEVLGGGLVAFVVVAALTALGVALVADAASATFVASRRMGNPTLPGFHAAVSGDATAQLIGDSMGSAAHLLAKSVAVVCLMLTPFLF